MISGTMVTKDRLEFDPIIPEDERRFYQKAYPNVNLVRERKVHCTVCKMHIGTAPSNESIIRMHPILRVTHCKKCHEFYNSGEFSKGEDGSELYCRWCGQGGEVYCCSNCPFVFCKSCIISNLSRGVVADIEQNENWSCFNCAPKMLWPLRAQHWALMKFIDKQKKAILNSNLSDAEIKTQMTKDRSLCCKVKKSTGYGTDSSESSDISLTKLKQKSGEKRPRKSLSKEDLSCRMSPALPKKAKPNDEVVCTPDVMSMLEPECQLTVAPNTKISQQPTASSPKIMSIPQPPKRNTPPPLVIRNAQSPQVRPAGPSPVVKKTVVGPRLPATTGGDFTTPVYHTINGYRIDLNSAAQQETVRLPNGKLIQVKRQGTGPQAVTTVQNAPNPQATPTRVIHNAVNPSFPNQQIVHSSGGHIIRAQLQTPRSITVQNSVMPQFQQQTPQQFQQITIRQPNQPIATIRYQGTSNQQVTNIIQNGTVQLLNGAAVTTTTGQVAAVRQVPTFVKQLFPNTPLGLTRNQLQNQICNAMEICQHLMSKVQTLTNSNAYKSAKSLTDVKELYIHLSYLLTYAIGRFKGLQDNCLSDMRELGFTTDANSLENGQLAAGMELVRTGKITDFVNTKSSRFEDLILKNMTTAAADSSTTNGKSKDTSDKSEELVAAIEIEDDNENENDKETDTGFVEWPQADILEDNDDCLLIDSSTDYESITNSDDDLLIECGERQPDDCSSPLVIDDESDDSFGDNEDDVPQRKISNPMNGFTHDLDTKLIELVKGKPTLWDPGHPNYFSVHQSRAWKEIEEQMPSGLNCRTRWKNLRYRYLNAQKRSANQSSKQVPPHRNAFLLKFLDKASPKPQTPGKQLIIGPDDHDFVVKLIRVVEKYPSLWHPKSLALIRHTSQPEVWDRVMDDLQDDTYKQASDAEEDEITIVEPKTDTITLDSDNEEESPTPVQRNSGVQQSVIKTHNNGNSNTVGDTIHTSLANQTSLITPTTTTNENNELTAQFDFTNILAGMFDIDMTEQGNNGVQQPKKPRKKTTNKPNPTLLKQKEIQERERLENLKKNDAKLKMQVQIPLNKVEEIYQYAKPLVDELKCEKHDEESESKKDVVVVNREEKIEVKVTVKKDETTTVHNEESDMIKKPEEESNTDDKDESEENLFVVVVEDMDNSKEDDGSKNDVEDNESVEIIEHEESQDPDEDQSKEDSQLSETTTKDSESREQVKNEKSKENENDKRKEIEEKEENGEVSKVSETISTKNKDTHIVEIEETTTESVKVTNETGCKAEKEEEKKGAVDIAATNTPENKIKKTVIFPIGNPSLEKVTEDGVKSSHSSHTLSFKGIISKTGAV